MTRVRVWLVVLPLLLAGTELAQWLLDRFAPESYKGADPFDQAALEVRLAPLLIAVAAVAVCAGLLLHARPGANPRFPRRVFAVLPLVVFAVQEHVEYGLGHGDWPWTVALQWSFGVGLLLQVPLVLAVYLAARLLIRVASSAFRRRPAEIPHPAYVELPGLPRPSVLLASCPGRLPGQARFNRGPPALPSL